MYPLPVYELSSEYSLETLYQNTSVVEAISQYTPVLTGYLNQLPTELYRISRKIIC